MTIALYVITTVARHVATKVTACCGCDDEGGGGGPGDGYVDFFDEFFSISGPSENFYDNFYVTSGTRPE